MRNKMLMTDLFTLLIIFSFLSPVFSGEHNWEVLDIKFGMSKKEILKKDKGAKFNKSKNIIENNGISYFGYKSDVRYNCDAIVPYSNDRLFNITYKIEHINNYLEEFANIQSVLEKKYGKPSDSTMLFWMDENNNIDYNMLNRALMDGYINISVIWNFKDYNISHLLYRPYYLISHNVEYYTPWAEKDYFNHEKFITKNGGLCNAFMYGLKWGMDMDKTEKEIKKTGYLVYSPYKLKKLKNLITIDYQLIKDYESFPMKIFFNCDKDKHNNFNILPSYIIPSKSSINGLCGIQISLEHNIDNDAVYLLVFLNINDTMDKLSQVVCEKRSITKKNKILLKEPDELYLNYHKGIFRYDYVWKTKYFTLHNTLFKEKSGKNKHELWIFPPD